MKAKTAIAALGLLLVFSCEKQERSATFQNTPQQHPEPSSNSDYYKEINFNQDGQEIYDALAVLTISRHQPILSYADRHQYLYSVDEAPGHPGMVFLLYSGELRPAREFLSGTNRSPRQTFNTEHVFPQSLIVNNAKGDLHHLRVCDIRINQERGRLKFTGGKGAYSKTENGWYPGDQWKGDVARMIFYLNLRYNEDISETADLNLLLQWHLEDEVSAFERMRNQKIYDIQGNRNPFIDHPEVAFKIWKRQ